MNLGFGPTGLTTPLLVNSFVRMSQAPPPDDGRDSSPPQKPLASWYAQGLSDGVGDRLLMFDNSDAPSLELLRVRPELASAPGFEEALRERVQRLSRFRHPSFARVRSVENLEPDEGLAVVSNYTPGKRLSELLHQANGPRFAKALIRQLAPALALLQEQSAGPGHGTLNLDRIVVTPEGRLTIVEYVLGAAIDTLGLNSSQLASLGIAVPASDGETSAPLDASTDIYQLGLIALSVLRRPASGCGRASTGVRASQPVRRSGGAGWCLVLTASSTLDRTGASSRRRDIPVVRGGADSARGAAPGGSKERAPTPWHRGTLRRGGFAHAGRASRRRPARTRRQYAAFRQVH